MEKKPNEIMNKEVPDFSGKKITRKEALKKAGLVAVSATTMMVLLNNKANATSGTNDGFDPGNCGPSASPGHR
jgi:hypothetical protein